MFTVCDSRKESDGPKKEFSFALALIFLGIINKERIWEMQNLLTSYRDVEVAKYRVAPMYSPIVISMCDSGEPVEM